MEKDALIRTFRNLAPLGPKDEEYIRARFTHFSVQARTYLMQAGEVAQQVYFINKGCVRVAIENKDGEDVSCHFAMEHDFVANYESFITGLPSNYALQALEPCELLAIDRRGLQEIYALTQYGERIGRLLAEGLFIDTLNRLTSFYMDTPEKRYAQFGQRYSALMTRLPQHYIASYIGVRPQSLSRIKRRSMEMSSMNPSA
jgi:CRP-like cAMP-binding protein